MPRSKNQQLKILYVAKYLLENSDENNGVVAEGIAAARQNGKKLGRPALEFPPNWNEVYSSWKNGEITAKTAMERTNTKRTSFYKLVNMTN